MLAENYDPALKYGATLVNNDLGSGIVSGVKTSMNNFYGVVAVGTTGTTAVSIFGGTAPTSGTITGFWLVTSAATAGSAGTISLLSTTAGTIATIANVGTNSAYVGGTTGTSVLNAAFATGDTVTVQGVGAGTSTAYVTFVTAN